MNQQSSCVFPYTMPPSFYGWLCEHWHLILQLVVCNLQDASFLLIVLLLNECSLLSLNLVVISCKGAWQFFFTRWFNPTSFLAVNNFCLHFRGWFSTVPDDRYFFTTLSIVDQSMSTKSEIYDLLSFFLFNFTINSLVSVLNSLLLQPISFVYNLQEVSTTDVKWCHGSRDVLFSLTFYNSIIIIWTDVLM